MAVVNQDIINVLRQVRKIALQVWQKQEAMDGITARITSAEAAVDDLGKGYSRLKTEPERQERQDKIDKVADELDDLYALQKRLPQELKTHKEDLQWHRSCLEDQLWNALVESGEVPADEDVLAAIPDILPGEEVQRSAAADQVTSPEEYQRQKAESLLYTRKAELEEAQMRFHYLEGNCKAREFEFENGIHAEWHDMSRTEFDLEQLAVKIDHTQTLIRAEEAYSEAARHAVEVGLVRDDAEQSCHFLDEADDGNCSDNQDALFGGEQDQDTAFIEHWRQAIVGPTCRELSTRAESDGWEVDSIEFGEGTSAHADEWEKIRINRWDEMREAERKQMHEAGMAADADELLCGRSRRFDSPEPAPAMAEAAGQLATGEPARVGLWRPHFHAVRDLVNSGQAAIARFSANWSAHRSSAV